MSVTHIDIERMTESVGAGTAWSDAEAAHLAGCADCRLELEMLAAARRLGASQPVGFDGPRVAAAVRRRLEAEPGVIRARGVRRSAGWLAGLAAAAAVALSVYIGMPKAGPRIPPNLSPW